jgi:hypothetical protein
MKRSFVAATLVVLTLSTAGCGPATFVSTQPPPDVHAEAWFRSPVAKVESALRQAMSEDGLSLEPEDAAAVVVGVKQQLPYVDEESGQPASGPLPVYRLRATITRADETRVEIVLDPKCVACDGQTPYEWEYPCDVIRSILDRTRRILRENRARVSYPPRYRPARWHRPPRR